MECSAIKRVLLLQKLCVLYLKCMEFGQKCSNLYFKKNEIINFKPNEIDLNLLLNPYSEFMLMDRTTILLS